MSKKCCKEDEMDDKYIVLTVDDGDNIDMESVTKGGAEDIIAELLSGDFEVSDIHVYKLLEVDFDVERGEIDVEILD